MFLLTKLIRLLYVYCFKIALRLTNDDERMQSIDLIETCIWNKQRSSK